MKRFATILSFVLAMNFVAVAAAVGWLYRSGRLERENIKAIRAILFPVPAPAESTTRPATQPATRPVLRLDELLAQQAGRPATEQVEFIQRAFDAQQAMLDGRHRELMALRDEIDAARAAVSRDRAALETQAAALLAQKQEAERLAADKGFQDTLERYQAMSTKQVKAIFMSLSDQTVMQYLQAMEPRVAARIIKEYSSAEETSRIQRILEMMRRPAEAMQASGTEARD